MAESTLAAHRPAHASAPEPVLQSLAPAGGGWHCSHLYYSFDRAALKQLSDAERTTGVEQMMIELDPDIGDAPMRLQTSIVSGQKADFGVLMLDPDPLEDRPRPPAAAGHAARTGDPADVLVRLDDRDQRVRAIGRAVRRAARDRGARSRRRPNTRPA